MKRRTAKVESPKPRKREPKRKRGSQRQLNLAHTRAIIDLQKRVEKLERKENRRLIGFGASAEGIETCAPDLDEIAETEIIG